MTEIIKGRWYDIEKKETRKITASYSIYKEWKQDPKGYFLIRIDREKKEIQAGFCTADNKLIIEIIGKNAEEIYNTILRENIVSTLQHAAYLGLELYKAEVALCLNIGYIQDSPLNFEELRRE